IASVWVPFTSESKEAIAEYDEIHKEITLALRECGRRLGVFLRRRERAASEFRRRNIFELYIEEVAEACNRLKGGKLAIEKLKEQLQKIAAKRTGGQKTDEILGYEGGGPEGLPHSIIVTEEGAQGDAPELPAADQKSVEASNDSADNEKEPELPILVDEEPKPSGKAKRGSAKVSKELASKKESAKQMSLGFD